ncbi:MAG TPA: hypothetical protein VIE66_04320 [Methylocella sp.]|jgi:hypothetical protein
MTDPLGRTLEHRIIILEKWAENLEERQAAFTMALLKSLASTPEDRRFLRAWLEQLVEGFKDQSEEVQEDMAKTLGAALAKLSKP